MCLSVMFSNDHETSFYSENRTSYVFALHTHLFPTFLQGYFHLLTLKDEIHLGEPSN